MKINHSQELAQRVQEHLDKNHMKYMFDEDAGCFHFPIYAAPELSEEDQQLFEKLLHISEEPDNSDEDENEDED